MCIGKKNIVYIHFCSFIIRVYYAVNISTAIDGGSLRTGKHNVVGAENIVDLEKKRKRR